MLFLVPFILAAASCGEGKDDTAPPEGDSDTDSDSDSDSDTDADADADSDADADGDSDADSDTDTDPNAPPTLDESASAVLVGEADRDWFGEFVTGGGDLDGDGFDDMLVLATGVGYSGALYVFAGPVSAETTTAEYTAKLEGATLMGSMITVAIPGDTNGDGFDDVVVGADSPAESALYFGPVTGELDFADYDAFMSWDEGYEFQVFAAGDVDGNGTDDLILDDERTVFVMSTPLEGEVDVESEAWAILEPPRPTEEDPCWVDAHTHWYIEYERDGSSAAVGDLDGDGFGELIVTNDHWNEQWWERDPSEPCASTKGIAYIVQGPISGVIDLETTATVLEGEEDGAIAGDAGPMGDADGDGLADFFVTGGEEGTVFIVFGPLTAGGAIGDLPNVARIVSGSTNLAYDQAGIGDVDGDGLGDFVTGFVDFGADWKYGAAIMLAPFSGTRLIDDAEHLYRGDGELSWAGKSVTAAGDVDADGLMDVIIGSHRAQSEGEYRGQAYLFYGADL
jgi:hypothetical protein